MSDIAPDTARPAAIWIVVILGYVQAAWATVLGILLLVSVADDDFAAQYNVDNAAVIAAVILIVAGLIIATVTTGVLFGTRFMRILMMLGLLVSLWAAITSALRGGAFLWPGIAHAVVALVTMGLLFTPAVRRYFSR